MSRSGRSVSLSIFTFLTQHSNKLVYFLIYFMSGNNEWTTSLPKSQERDHKSLTNALLLKRVFRTQYVVSMATSDCQFRSYTTELQTSVENCPAVLVGLRIRCFGSSSFCQFLLHFFFLYMRFSMQVLHSFFLLSLRTHCSLYLKGRSPGSRLFSLARLRPLDVFFTFHLIVHTFNQETYIVD